MNKSDRGQTNPVGGRPTTPIIAISSFFFHLSVSRSGRRRTARRRPDGDISARKSLWRHGASTLAEAPTVLCSCRVENRPVIDATDRRRAGNPGGGRWQPSDRSIAGATIRLGGDTVDPLWECRLSTSGIRARVAASYLGQVYITVLGLAITPVYFHYMGASAYGLVGIFTMVQLWLQVLDAGLSATLIRETARFGAGRSGGAEFRSLVGLLGRIFLVMALVIAVAGAFGSRWISLHWLKAGKLPIDQVSLCVGIIIVTAAIRWRTEPYRSIIIGFERIVWLYVATSAIVTLRYVGAALLVIRFSGSFTLFFEYQLAMSILEAVIIIWKSYSLLPAKPAHEAPYVHSWTSLRPFLAMSMGVALTSSIALIASQFDKLLLSSLLTLRAYGVFSLAIIVSTGVALLGMPIYQAVLPRLTALMAQAKAAEFAMVYGRATAFVAALLVPACLILAIFGAQSLWVWTGDLQAARQAAPILRWYALGNCLAAFTNFTLYLQYAHGNLKLQNIGSVVFLAVLIPAVSFAAVRFGALGTGVVWFVQNGLYLLIWTYVVHRKFAPGVHWRWLGRDIVITAAPAIVIVAIAARLALPWYASRAGALAMLVGIGLFCFLSCAALIPGAMPMASGAVIRARRAIGPWR
jgi:O-antigen/teichoic acid export membrane protein